MKSHVNVRRMIVSLVLKAGTALIQTQTKHQRRSNAWNIYTSVHMSQKSGMMPGCPAT